MGLDYFLKTGRLSKPSVIARIGQCCKHISAVIYLICAEIDKNPFVVFDIHNCDLLEMISDFDNGKLEHVQKLLLIDDILKHTNCLSNQFDQSVLEEINLSTIPDFGERITTILSNDPPFYQQFEIWLESRSQRRAKNILFVENVVNLVVKFRLYT